MERFRGVHSARDSQNWLYFGGDPERELDPGLFLTEFLPLRDRNTFKEFLRNQRLWWWSAFSGCSFFSLKWKSAQRDANILVSKLSKRCSKAEQKVSPRHRPPSRGHGTAKIQSAGDGHYLYLQTQIGKDRCTLFRVIVVTDPRTHTHKHAPPARPPIANTQSHRQDR